MELLSHPNSRSRAFQSSGHAPRARRGHRPWRVRLQIEKFPRAPIPSLQCFFTMGAFIESRNHTVQCLLRAPGSPIATLLLIPGSILFGEADSADPNGGVTYILKRLALVMI
jgi:hypothetical protein